MFPSHLSPSHPIDRQQYSQQEYQAVRALPVQEPELPEEREPLPERPASPEERELFEPEPAVQLESPFLPHFGHSFCYHACLQELLLYL